MAVSGGAAAPPCRLKPRCPVPMALTLSDIETKHWGERSLLYLSLQVSQQPSKVQLDKEVHLLKVG